ncbi:hypothetical protein DUI87_34771 [Hirundo rustica rustica]|uniref:RNase H type-1 domain-containing protein n=1 Tax=Hirundo rustica rustica TaxID=333673 RepID=A0A3M0IIC0_HIRRU|nr:hypothetical protein DUI87_34771 [Hirundo rustica rustica]
MGGVAGGVGFVNAPLTASEVRNFKKELGNLVEDPRGLDLLEGDRGTIYTDSRYAYGIIHTFGKIWEERGYLNSKGKDLAHKEMIKSVLTSLLKPIEIAVVHVKGHQKGNTFEGRGNQIADQEAKQAALNPKEPVKALTLSAAPEGEEKQGEPKYDKTELKLIEELNMRRGEHGEWITSDDHISYQLAQTRAVVYQIRLAVDYLLADEGGICGKFNSSECCLEIDDKSEVIRNISKEIRKVAATQFRSFVRQLYRYGFRKVPGRAGAAAPGDAGAWVHYRNPWFRRDCPDLLLRIRRRSAANTQRRAAGPEGRRRPPCGSQQLPGPRPLPGERHGRARFQPLPRERPPLARRPPCGFHLLHRERPGPAWREGPSRFQELYGERPLPAERELLRVPPCHFQGFHGEQLLPPQWEGPRSRMQELYGEQPPLLDRELLWMQPCSFQQLHREQQPPASNPPAAAGTSAPHAPAGSAGCAASTASSSAQNAPAQEESPALDLGLEIEKMIREIRNSLPVKAPSAQGNINVAPESPREDPMNRAAAEEVSSGTESCGNSSPEPEEPGLHIVQVVSSCDPSNGESMDPTRYGSDGWDFISFQLGSGSFAVSNGATWITQRCWESKGIMVEQMKLYLGHTSVEGPPKYIRYGWEALEYKGVAAGPGAALGENNPEPQLGQFPQFPQWGPGHSQYGPCGSQYDPSMNPV